VGRVVSDNLKEKYFLIVRIIIMLLFSGYGVMINEEKTGVSAEILLLISLYISMVCLKEFVDGRKKAGFLVVAAIDIISVLYMGGAGYIFLGAFLYYEILLCIRARRIWYYLIYMTIFIEKYILVSIIEEMPLDVITQIIILTFMLVFYMQHEFVVTDYEKQMMQDTITQQSLKRDMRIQETTAREQMKKNILMSENKVLEERAALSQTLHDKLGHNINGSIYQLEAIKVIMDKDPDKARSMTQAVIDQLRTGMDEIRAILRKERPEKKQMALLQLYEFCEDCNNKGVEAEFESEGDLSKVPDHLWEVILDNAFEAVTNSMKYSSCEHIDIGIVVMNKMVRCTIKDDGVGCDKIEDGMGLSGMRKRIREAGGTIDFESKNESGTQKGFKVNMLLPL
jgi:Signal transduction histidine kinase